MNSSCYPAEAMLKMGFTPIVMGGGEGDGPALRFDMLRYGFKRGVRKLVADRGAPENLHSVRLSTDEGQGKGFGCGGWI